MSLFLFVFCNGKLKKAAEHLCSELMEAKWGVSAAGLDAKIVLEDEGSKMQIASLCLDGKPKDPSGFFAWIKKMLSRCDIPSFGLLLSYPGTLRWGNRKRKQRRHSRKDRSKSSHESCGGFSWFS